MLDFEKVRRRQLNNAPLKESLRMQIHDSSVNGPSGGIVTLKCAQISQDLITNASSHNGTTCEFGVGRSILISLKQNCIRSPIYRAQTHPLPGRR